MLRRLVQVFRPIPLDQDEIQKTPEEARPLQFLTEAKSRKEAYINAAKVYPERERPIPLPFAVVFLSVALNEGHPVGKYAKDLNMTRFAIFKYLQSIGDRGRHNAPALGLVAIKRGYREKTSVVLTDKGREVAAQVIGRLRGGPKLGTRLAEPPTAPGRRGE